MIQKRRETERDSEELEKRKRSERRVKKRRQWLEEVKGHKKRNRKRGVEYWKTREKK